MRAAVALVLLALAASASGCWDSREPNDLLYGLAVGFDLDDEGQYIAWVQFANPSAAGGSGSQTTQGTPTQPFWAYSGKGHSPAEAVAAISPGLSRNISLSHAEVLLVSERLAREGIGPVVDYMSRNPEMRLNVSTAVVDGDLRTLMESEFPVDPIPALSIRRMLTKPQTVDPSPAAADLLTLAIGLRRPGSDLILPVLKVDEEGEGDGGQESSGAGDETSGNGGGQVDAGSRQGKQPPKAPAEHIGGAVFRGERMMGFIDGHASRGTNYVLGAAIAASFHVDSPRGGGLSILVERTTAKVIPSFDGERVSVLIQVAAQGYVEAKVSREGGGGEGGMEGLIGQKAGGQRMSEEEFNRSVRSRIAQAMREDILKALAKSVEYGSDFLQLGNAVYRRLYKVWQSGVGERWYQLLPEVDVEVQVEVVLTHPGLVREE
jgi:spore germination protein KC